MSHYRTQIQSLSVSKRQVKKYAFYSCGILFLLMFVIYLRSDDCFKHYHIQLLCDEFQNGNIAGQMCHELCVRNTLYLRSCSKDFHGNLVFTVNGTTVVKMPDHHHPGVKSFSHVYQIPEQGISMDQFRGMVNKLLAENLGGNDHKNILQQLMNMADVNKDDKVSLAEAKTLWSLLKHNEFLVLQVLHHSTHVPQVSQFCGEAYMLKNIPPPGNRELYDPHSAVRRYLFPRSYSWGFLEWINRAKIAVGLLEFTLDVYQHQSDGSFYMCDVNETNIGFSDKHDFLMLDLSMVLPKKTLESRFQGLNCATNDQCQYTPHCTTTCDITSGKCMGHLVRPNLSLVCDILKPYLLPDMPKVIQPDFLNLIFRCVKLQTLAQDFEVQHSLIVNDLRSLLWRHIQSDV